MTIYLAILLGLTVVVGLGLAIEPLLPQSRPDPPRLPQATVTSLLAPPASRIPSGGGRRPIRFERGQLVFLLGAAAFVGLAVLLAVAALRTGDETIAVPVARFEGQPSADLLLDPSAGELIVGTSEGVWRGGFGGTGPTRVAGVNPQPIALAGEGLLLTTDRAIIGLNDGIRSAINLPENGQVVGSSRSGRRLVLATGDRQLFLSNDGGSTWRRALDRAPTGLSALSISDRDGRIWAATRVQGVLVGDGDSGWAGANGFVNGALPTVDIRDIDYDPDSGDTFSGAAGSSFSGALYAATAAGLFRSLDGGLSWNRLPTGFAPVAVLGVNAGQRALWALADDGAIYRSSDGGRTWN